MSTMTAWSTYPIHESILKSLDEHEFKCPLPIQEQSLKASLLDDKNILGAARTGSGKTLAYAIPVVNRILANHDNPCSSLKMKILSTFKKNQDFEMIDGNMMEVEDMIVGLDESSDDEDADAMIKSEEVSCPEAIILVPTRELAVQVKDEVEKICKYTKINTCCIVGGLSQDKQKRVLKKLKPEIIIATPGRLYDLVEAGDVTHVDKASIASIRTLIIDEGDRMIERGHFTEMIKLLDIIKESSKHRDDQYKFRIYLFSATLIFMHKLPDRFKLETFKKGVKSFSLKSKSKGKDSKDQKVTEVSKDIKVGQMLSILGIDRKETVIIDLNNDKSHGRPDCNQLLEYKIKCLHEEKDLYLYYFLLDHQDRRTIIFCNSKDCLPRLMNIMKFLNIPSLKLCGDMDQKKRLSCLETFRRGNKHVLIATEVAARGLDIKDLDCVVNYQVPRTCESYIHRSGRTARLDNKGVCLTIYEPDEINEYKRLCNTINSGKEFEEYPIDQLRKRFLRDRMLLVQQCDVLDHQIRKRSSNQDWFSKAAKKCDIELDEDDLRRHNQGKCMDQKQMDEAKDRRRLKALQKQLNVMLRKKIRVD